LSINSAVVKLADKELLVEDVSGSLPNSKMIIMNVLMIVQYLMNAHQSCLKKVISMTIPSQLFKLLNKVAGDQVRV